MITEPDPVAPHVTLVVDHLNEDHGDALLLIGRVLGDRAGATAAVATGVDQFGLDVEVDGEPMRFEFANPVTDLAGIRGESVALVARARAAAPDGAPTLIEQQNAAMAGIRTFITGVVRTRQLTPAMKEITFGGGDLAQYESRGPDDFVYLLAPPVGRTRLTIDASFTWEGHERMPLEDRPVGANYTVRRWRPEGPELDIWFVLHGDHGHAAAWAAGAKPGDPAGLWGPRVGYAPPDGTDWHLLVADETGLPAVAAILESLPADAAGCALLEVADATEHQELRDFAGFDVNWLHRNGAAPGTSDALVEAVRQLVWPDATVYAWGGAESRIVTSVRSHLRTEVGLSRDAVSMTGYWRLDTGG